MGVVGAYIVLGGVVAVEEPADSEDDEPYSVSYTHLTLPTSDLV